MATTMRFVRLAARTTSGTQDFTVPGLGASSLIKAALFVVSMATADATPVNGAALSIGHTTGSTHFASSTCSRNGTTTPSAFSQANATDVVLLLDPASADIAGPSVSVYARAVFSAFITDGVRVNWTTAPATGVLVTCVLFSGAQASGDSEIVDLELSNPGDSPNLVTNVHGAVPSLGLFVSATSAAYDDTPFAAGSMCVGAVRANDFDMLQSTVAWGETSFTPAPATTVVNTYADSAAVLRDVHDNDSTENATVVEIISGGFGMDCSADPFQSSLLSLTFGDASVWVGQVQAPTDTSGADVNSIGFRPQGLIVVACGASSDTTVEHSDGASPFSFGVVDRFGAACTTFWSEHGVSTTVTRSATDSRAVYLPSRDGIVDEVLVDVTEFRDDGFHWQLASGTNDGRMTFVIAFSEALQAYSAGAGSTQGSPSGSAAVAGAASGESATNGLARGAGAIAAQTTGAADTRNTPRGAGAAPAAATSSTADAHAGVTGSYAGAGQTAGSASTAAACGGSGVVSGSLHAGSQVAALIAGSGALAGETRGLAECLGHLLGALPLPGGSTSGSSATWIDDTITPEVIGIYETLGNLVRARVLSEVESGESVATAYDNLPFAKPGSAAYVRARVLVDGARQIAFGAGNRYRKSGELVATVHAPVGEGWGEVMALAQSILDAFTNVTTAHVHFRTAWVGRGQREDGEWLVEVHCPFEADVVLALQAGVAPTGPLDASVATGIICARMEAVATALAVETCFDAFEEPLHDASDTWVRFSVLGGQRFVAQRGIPLTYRTPGIALAAIYTPLEQGDKAGLRIADAIADAFRAVTDRGVTFKTPLVREVARDGAWWRVDVTCPYQWDEFSS